MAMTKAEKTFKWIDRNFGIGGVENYTDEQVESLRKFLRAFFSSDFGEAERESLVEIAKKLNKLDRETREDMQDAMVV